MGRCDNDVSQRVDEDILEQKTWSLRNSCSRSEVRRVLSVVPRPVTCVSVVVPAVLRLEVEKTTTPRRFPCRGWTTDGQGIGPFVRSQTGRV